MLQKKIYFIFFFLLASESYSASIGFSTGFTYQSFFYNGSLNSKEQSGFGADINLQGFFFPHPRVLIISELGFSYHESFYNPYIGLKTGFVLYPKYHPFIGLTLREHFYNKILNKKNQWVTSLSFSLGSEIFSKNNHSIWIFADYLIIQSQHKIAISSKLSLNLGYSYSFK